MIGWGSFFCYFHGFLFLLSGSETGSLLPFRLSFPVFGLRDGLSVTFSSFFSCFRAQRRALCYLFAFLFLFSGSETGSLLPFRLSFPVFGLRDGLSVTFPPFFSCFRAQRRALCYLFVFLFLFSGSETGSLLPFRLSFPTNRRREHPLSLENKKPKLFLFKGIILALINKGLSFYSF
ncbi:hypothetical protein BACSP_01099 [Bacillus sp. T2.9-1]|nr:hypothetical protein BACSP_01099 [Bacillus sp. T2.9-1]